MSSKKQSARERREVLAKIEADRRRGERRRAYLVTGVAAAVVIAIVAGTVAGLRSIKEDRQNTASQGGDGIGELQTYKVASREHVEGEVDYPQSPPVGGNHNPVWVNCGAYSKDVPATSAVHTMEHGAVWLTYREDLPADDVSVLDDVAASNSYVLVTPYDDQEAPVVASAWGVQVALDGPDDPRLNQFLTDYLQGAQTPEPGAPCTGGAGM